MLTATDLKGIQKLLDQVQERLDQTIKSEIASLRVETKADIASFRVETRNDIASLRSETKSEIASLRVETKEDITSLRLETKKGIAALRLEMRREFKRVHSDQNLIIKHFNEEFLGLQSKVETLERKAKVQNFS